MIARAGILTGTLLATLAGLFLVAFGAATILLFRNAMHETSTAATRSKDAGKIGELRKHIPACLTVAGLTAGGSLSFYTFTTYMPKYLFNTAHIDKVTASQISTANSGSVPVKLSGEYS